MLFRNKNIKDIWIYGARITTQDTCRTGSLLRTKVGVTEYVARAPTELVRPDAWFTLEIIAQGKHAEIRVNGVKTAAAFLDDILESGTLMIGVSPDSTALHVRKIEIKELPPTPVETQPFVVLAKAQRPETRHPTLAAAVATAQSGDTIEIRGNGPFVTPAIETTKPLCIRAATGFRPHLKYQPVGLKPEDHGFMLSAQSPLVLEGLTLEWVAQAGTKERLGSCNIVRNSWKHAAPIRLANCRLVGQSGIGQLGLATTNNCAVMNCALLGDTFGSIKYF